MRHGHGARLLFRTVSAFPPPHFLFMPSAALSISDRAIHIATARLSAAGYIPQMVHTEPLPKGVVRDGIIKDADALVARLTRLRVKSGRLFARCALPESLAYIFTTPLEEGADIEETVAFSLSENVPTDPARMRTAFVRGDDYISVAAYDKEAVAAYERVCRRAGFMLHELTPSVFALARAVAMSDKTVMVLDIAATTTTVLIARGGAPLFATSIPIGNLSAVEHIMDAYRCDWQTAMRLQSRVGLQTDKRALAKVLESHVQELFKAVMPHVERWNARQGLVNRRNAIHAIVLTGAGGALRGLRRLFSREMTMPVWHGHVWQSLFDVTRFIPSVTRADSLQYAITAGLLAADIRRV